MLGLKKKRKPDFLETISSRDHFPHVTDGREGLDFLVAFFSAIRPSHAKGKRNAENNMNAVMASLHQNEALLQHLRHAILSVLVRTDLSAALMESGIPLARGFWQEFFGRLRHKLIPPLQRENDFLYVMDRIFFHNTDYQWVEDISRESWIRFFERIGLSFHVDDRRIVLQLLKSLKILSFQVAQLGLEKEVVNYIPEADRENNPFVAQTDWLRRLEERLLDEGQADFPIGPISEGIDKGMENAYRCLDYIRENQSQKGASLHQTYILILLGNRLDRISIIVDLLDKDQTKRTGGPLAEGPSLDNIRSRDKFIIRPAANVIEAGKFVDFFQDLVRNENRKNSMLEFMSQTMGYLAYQIAEHKGVKGNKYITSTWPEYRAMLISAMGGGAWICLVVLIKNLLIRANMAIFWHGFAYSVNYSVGFILIEETHTTLATKQPAFTASALAGTLDSRKTSNKPNLYNLAITVAKVSRSQIASFAGNLLVVFPGVWLLAWLYDLVFGKKLVEGEVAARMLMDQHPWQSLSLLYACNTGVFLFLSGIIAGYVQNKLQYSQISKRLQIHPLLRVSLSAQRLRRMADYIENHAGSLAGNLALGFFLGMSSIIVHIFGIPFDIRHITISAGNTSLAVYGLGFDHVRPWYLFTVVMGVLGIGLMNFLVSFSLAFFVAARSRGIHLREYPEFIGILWRYFRNNPLDFIRPRKLRE